MPITTAKAPLNAVPHWFGVRSLTLNFNTMRLTTKINNLEDNLSMGLLSESEAERQIKDLYCQILDHYLEGTEKFDKLTKHLVEVQNIAFDIYDIEAWC